jgi:HD superfamily phosphohydrolase
MDIILYIIVMGIIIIAMIEKLELKYKPYLINKLINSKPMQRLKYIDQYGMLSKLKIEHKSYSRFNHSIGVYKILKFFNASIEEQIAGLLHDVSHTVFSHVGDKVFNKVTSKINYQDSVHNVILKSVGLTDILDRYHDINIKSNSDYMMLHRSRPDINADSIEYVLSGSILEGYINEYEKMQIFNDIVYNIDEQVFEFKHREYADKFAQLMYDLNINVWQSDESKTIDRWLGMSIKRAISIGIINRMDLHILIDDVVWNILLMSKDHIIIDYMNKTINYRSYIMTDIPSRSYYINPRVIKKD